jgi:hypothetical protein
MEVVLLPDAEKDLAFWKSNKAVLKRITQLNNPFNKHLL